MSALLAGAEFAYADLVERDSEAAFQAFKETARRAMARAAARYQVLFGDVQFQRNPRQYRATATVIEVLEP